MMPELMTDAVLKQIQTLFRVGTLGDASDGELLDRFATGAEATASAAFAVLVERHGSMVRRVCRRILGDPHDAEDAAQAVFLVLARRARLIRRRDSVAAWLFGVARRVANRARRDAGRRRRIERRGAEMTSPIVDNRPSDSGMEVLEELDRLPERLRAPIVLCYLEGLTRPQAARLLRCPLRTTERRIAQGLERLRGRLVRRGSAWTAGLIGSALIAEGARAGELSTAWAEATVRAACQIAAGRSAAGIATISALRWASGTLRNMLMVKIGWALASILVAGAAGVGLVPLTHGQKARDADPPRVDPKPAEPPPPIVPSPEVPENGPIVIAPKTGPGRLFHLRVVAADTGKPIPKAEGSLLVGMRLEWVATDDLGRLDIRHSTGPADDSIALDVAGDGYALQRHRWPERPVDPIPDGATIKLFPGESLGGIVQDEQGRPVERATVFLWSHNYKHKDKHELLYNVRAVTGPDGRWRTQSAPETTGELLGMRVIHPDYLSDHNYHNKARIPKIADLRAGTAVSVLGVGDEVKGYVRDGLNRPVAGAVVIPTDDKNTLFDGYGEFIVTTVADGFFRIAGLKPGSKVYLLARKKGHAPGTLEAIVGRDQKPLEIALGKPRTFAGQVSDPKGLPIAGAFVCPDSWLGYRSLGVYLYTDANGLFHWDDAPNDPLLVNISKSGYLSRTQVRAEPQEEAIIFALARGLEVSGRLHDDGTGAPIAQGEIETGIADPETGAVKAWEKLESDAFILEGHYLARFRAEESPTYRVRIKSEGFEPFASRVIRRDEQRAEIDVRLKKDNRPVPTARVLRPDGKPLAGARVYRGDHQGGLTIMDDQVSQRDPKTETLTGPDGSFPIPQVAEPFMVLVLHDEFFAFASKEALAASTELKAQPYGRIEGKYLIGGRPGRNRALRLDGLRQDRATLNCTLWESRQTTTDGEGRFTFERVIPMPGLRVGRDDPEDAPEHVGSLGDPVHVTPGKTSRVTIGGRGRPIVGRLAAPTGWPGKVDFRDRSAAVIQSDRPTYPYPWELFRGKGFCTMGDWGAWSASWSQTPGGRAYLDSRVGINVGVAADGSFRIDDVPAGSYRLNARVNEAPSGGAPGPFAWLTRSFNVPTIPGGRSDEPLDLGILHLRPRTALNFGDPAPPLKVKTIDGKPIALSDYEGKYLLLDFVALWNDQSRFQVSRLFEINQEFGDDPKFAILSLTLAADTPETRAEIAEKGQPWPQAIIGPLSNPIADAYGVEARNVPAAILIGPDGKIAAKNLWYEQIKQAVARALGRPINK